MFRRKIDVVHFVREQDVVRFFQRNTAREVQVARRTFWIFQFSTIRALQNHFARSRLNFGAIEQDRQRNTNPFGIPDRAKSPLHAVDFGLEKISVVAGALQRDRNFLPCKFGQFVIVDFKRLLHFALNPQSPFVLVDLWNRKMCSNVKRFRRRNKTIERLKRHLEIEWSLAVNNFAVDKLLLALHHLAALIKRTLKRESGIENRKSKMEPRGFEPLTSSMPLRRSTN